MSRSAEGVEVAAARIVPVETHATVALDAPVHLVIDERTEVLVAERALREPVAAVVVTGHHRHVLQMALAALVADRAIVRMVHHQPLDDARAEFARFRILDRDARAFGGRRHARHDELAGVSFSSLNCLTAHCRHAPTDPIAGCQQKYGRSKPSERHAWSRFCAVVDARRRLSM